MQIPGANLVLGRGNPFILLVALSQSGNASGNLFWDDGDSIGMLYLFIYLIGNHVVLFNNLDSIETKTYNYFEFTLISSVSQQHP
jgi:hypothetical protein